MPPKARLSVITEKLKIGLCFAESFATFHLDFSRNIKNAFVDEVAKMTIHSFNVKFCFRYSYFVKVKIELEH